MKQRGKLNPARLALKELNTDLGSGNYIFVGSSIDMWSSSIPNDWILKTLKHINKYPDNKYLLQSKDPKQFMTFIDMYPELFGPNIVFATTMETNRQISGISKAPSPAHRMTYIEKINRLGFETMITVEPVMDFDLEDFIDMLRFTNATQINIGAVTGGHNLPEPSKEKVALLIEQVKPHLKNNIKRLMQ
jgi:DNA repair photolyase